MALSASLHLRQSQSLVMTPQLMQSIQLLQMTHLELNHFIAQEVEKNPLLELHGGDDEFGGSSEHGSREEAGQASGEDFGGTDEASGQRDLYDNATATDGARLNEQLDADFGNVYQDDTAPPTF